MKKIYFLSVLLIGIIPNTSFSQKKDSMTLSKKAIIVLRLSNGTEKLTWNPIFLGEQYKTSQFLRNPDFRKLYPNINAGAVAIFVMKPSVNRLLSLKDIFREFNIAAEDQTLPVELILFGKPDEINDRESICATENSIKSVKVDRIKKVIVITSY